MKLKDRLSQPTDTAAQPVLRVILIMRIASGAAKIVFATLALPNYVPVLVPTAIGLAIALVLLDLKRVPAAYVTGYALAVLLGIAFEAWSVYPLFLDFRFIQVAFLVTVVSNVFTAVGLGAAVGSVGAFATVAVSVVTIHVVLLRLPSDFQGLMVAMTAVLATTVSALVFLLVRNRREREVAELARTEADRLNKKLALMGAQLMDDRQRQILAIVAAGIAHEVNNPLTFMRGNLDFLVQHFEAILRYTQESHEQEDGDMAVVGRLSEEVADSQDILESFAAGLERLQAVVGRLREMFGVDQIVRREVSVAETVTTCVSALRPIRGQAVELTIDVPQNVGVYCHPVDLYTVVSNVLKNAFEAVGESGDVTIRARTRSGRVRVLVSDSGPGPDKDRLSVVFDPFYSTKADRGGIGVGLSLCRSIVQGYGGSIEFDASAGDRTVVAITIPENPALKETL